jgi:hypothetical protein
MHPSARATTAVGFAVALAGGLAACSGAGRRGTDEQ